MEHQAYTYLYNLLPAAGKRYLETVSYSEWVFVLKCAAISLTVLGVLCAAYSVFRFMGWRKYQGTWYSAKQFQLVVQEIYSGVREGRVPDYETMKILDEYVYGKKGSRLRRLTKADHI